MVEVTNREFDRSTPLCALSYQVTQPQKHTQFLQDLPIKRRLPFKVTLDAPPRRDESSAVLPEPVAPVINVSWPGGTDTLRGPSSNSPGATSLPFPYHLNFASSLKPISFFWGEALFVGCRSVVALSVTSSSARKALIRCIET